MSVSRSTVKNLFPRTIRKSGIEKLLLFANRMMQHLPHRLKRSLARRTAHGPHVGTRPQTTTANLIPSKGMKRSAHLWDEYSALTFIGAGCQTVQCE
jgi:hypothetical protein